MKALINKLNQYPYFIKMFLLIKRKKYQIVRDKSM